MVYNMPVFEMIELLKYIIDIMSGRIWTSPDICTVKLLKIYVSVFIQDLQYMFVVNS